MLLLGEGEISVNIRKIGAVAGVVLLVLILGVGGGIAIGRLMAAGGGEPVEDKARSRVYPLCDLGEFKIALPGSKYVEGHLVSFEPVLELENGKVAEAFNGEDYWRALFRNEVLSEVMAHSVEAFQTPEGMLDLAAAIRSKLNAVAPDFEETQLPIRRVLFKSFILQ